jgi:hypothetical protein
MWSDVDQRVRRSGDGLEEAGGLGVDDVGSEVYGSRDRSVDGLCGGDAENGSVVGLEVRVGAAALTVAPFGAVRVAPAA